MDSQTTVTTPKTSRKGKKNKFKTSYGNEEMYKFYKSKADNPVSISVFRKVLKEANKIILDEIVLEGKTIKLPRSLGVMYIKRIPLNPYQTTKVVDFHATNKVGKLVPHSNIHTNFVRYRVCWRKFRLKYIKPYSFVPSRYFKRYLAHAIKDLNIRY